MKNARIFLQTQQKFLHFSLNIIDMQLFGITFLLFLIKLSDGNGSRKLIALFLDPVSIQVPSKISLFICNIMGKWHPDSGKTILFLFILQLTMLRFKGRNHVTRNQVVIQPAIDEEMSEDEDRQRCS